MRAYICLARNDLDSNLLQVLDLFPNSSLETVYTAYRGQTGYLTWAPQSDTVVTHDSGAGVWHSSAIYYGLAAYILDNVEDNDNGNTVLTDARANLISGDLLTISAAGTALTLATIDARIQVRTGAGASGLTTAHSTGTVEEVLRIVSGESYYLPAESVMSAAARGFINPHYRNGSFLANTAVGTITCVTAIATDMVTIGGVRFIGRAGTENALTREFNITGTDATTAVSLATVINDPRNQALIGASNGTPNRRTVTATASVVGNVVTLTANQPGVFGDLTLATSSAATLVISGATLIYIPDGYRNHRLFVDTGELHLSKLSGHLSHLASATYAWLNPAFTYGAAGTALTVAGANILTAGVGRAVTVYDASGNVI